MIWKIEWEENHATGPTYTKSKIVEAKRYIVENGIGLFIDNGDTIKHSVPADKVIVTQTD